MLYFIHGTEYMKVVDKSHGLVEPMLSKKPDASLFKLNTDNWSDAQIQELVGGQGLFENKYIVQISKVLDNKEIADVILKILPDIAESQNIFIWTEEKVDSKTLKKIEKSAEKVQVFDKKEVKDRWKEFNIFSLGDALVARDKKKLWIGYTEALRHHAPEEIHGTLFWQVKSMILASKTKSPAESGLKPFVYTKSLKGSTKYSSEELHQLSSDLINLYHNARRGKVELDIALERFVLGV